MSIGERGEFVRYFIYSETDYSLQGIQSVLVVHHHLCRLLFVAEVFVVFGWGVRKVRRFNHFVSTLYADPESRMLYQVDLLLQLLVLTSVLSVIFNYVGRVVFVGSLWLALPSVLFTILIFLLFFQGMQNRVSMSEMIGVDNGFDDDGQTVGSEVTVGHDVSDESVTEPPSVKLQLRDRFEQLMDKEQLYLISDLKVSDVATHLGTNRTYLLNMLATEVGMTFSEYVNRRRIAYAKELMAKNPQMTKIQVAVAAGYSTPSSFYRNYQRYS
jgi:AraC-like DNA-binding protein